MSKSQDEIDDLISEFKKEDKEKVNSIIDNFDVEDSEAGEDSKLENVSLAGKSSEEVSDAGKFVLYPKEHKVIDKLDEINRESEEKVNKLFGKLESISGEIEDISGLIRDIKPYIEKHKSFMDYFVEHFPKTSVKNNYEYFRNIKSIVEEIESKIDKVKDDTFEAMEMLQFQDITRQKIDRVIAAIETLRNYLNNWFSSSYNTPRARVAHTIVDESEKEKIDEEVDQIIRQMQRGEIK